METVKHIKYSELISLDLSRELQQHEKLGFVLAAKQARQLRSLWDKYSKYWEYKNSNSGSIKTAISGARWLVKRAIVDMRYAQLDQINQLYIEQAGSIEPVEFEDKGDGDVIAIFRLKGSIQLH